MAPTTTTVGRGDSLGDDVPKLAISSSGAASRPARGATGGALLSSPGQAWHSSASTIRNALSSVSESSRPPKLPSAAAWNRWRTALRSASLSGQDRCSKQFSAHQAKAAPAASDAGGPAASPAPGPSTATQSWTRSTPPSWLESPSAAKFRASPIFRTCTKVSGRATSQKNSRAEAFSINARVSLFGTSASVSMMRYWTRAV
mmetsp:Transcript_76538/g.216410  ORF Transcript_76538/g.216410 Transcript_76538/m.216410 type:complete len:202 (-) Transcript_76538:158-763(-)